MSKRWNYKVVEVKPTWITLKPKQVEDALAALGQQGWELVSVAYVSTTAVLYLKKEA